MKFKIIVIFLLIIINHPDYAQKAKIDYIPSEAPQNLLWMDFFLPGYGMYSQKEYLWGTVYAVSKAGLIYLNILTWNRYAYYDSIADSAERINNREPGTLYFEHPDISEKYQSAEEYRSKSDQFFLFFIYSVVLQGAIHAVSYLHSKHLWYKKHKKPRYRFSDNAVKYADPFLNIGNNKLRFGFNYRFGQQ